MAQEVALLDQAAELLKVSRQELAPPPQMINRQMFGRAQEHARAAVREAAQRYREALLRLERLLAQPSARHDGVAHDVAAYNAMRTDALRTLSADVARARCEETGWALEDLCDCLHELPADAEEQAREAAAEDKRRCAELHTANAARLREREMRLQLVAALERPPSGARRWSLVWYALCDACGCADSVEAFEAFPGARSIPAVRDVLSRPLAAAGALGISESSLDAPVFSSANVGPNLLFITNDGTVAVQDNTLAHSGLRLHNLLTGRTGFAASDFFSWACAFDGEVFVGKPSDDFVSFAPLSAVFDGRPVAEFARFSVGCLLDFEALDRAADGLAVFRDADSSATLVVVDLAAKCSRRIMCDRYMYTVEPLSGVRVPGVLCAAWELGGEYGTLAVFDDGCAEELFKQSGGRARLLPSSTAPADLARAAAIGDGLMVLHSSTSDGLDFSFRQLESALGPRLFRDVFLCYDASAGAWRAVRVVVP